MDSPEFILPTFTLDMEPFRPVFSPPHLSIITIADHASLAMVQYANFIFDSPRNAFHIDLPSADTPPTSSNLLIPPPPTRSNTPSSIESFNERRNELARQLEHDFEILNVLGFNIFPDPTPIGRALMDAAYENRRPFMTEENYERFTGQCPLHQYSSRASAAWIIIHHGIQGSPSPQNINKLMPGMSIRIYDTSLARRNAGFETPWYFAILGRAVYREEGYHFFNSIPHLCVYTSEVYPISTTSIITTIAIPDTLVSDSAKLNSVIQPRTIGQRVFEDGRMVYPPLRPWEDNPTWRHPEWYQIEEWMRGERSDFPKVWAEILSKI